METKALNLGDIRAHIKTNFQEKTWQEIAQDLNLNEEIIIVYAGQMGLIKLLEHRARMKMIKGYLLDNHSSKTMSEMARELDISPSSIRHHMITMKLEPTQFHRDVVSKSYPEMNFEDPNALFQEHDRENWLI